MDSQEMIILMMARKLKEDADAVQQQKAHSVSGAEAEAMQLMERWLKLDNNLQQKTLCLINNENIKAELMKLRAHINRLMDIKPVNLSKKKFPEQEDPCKG